jgi:hypothetical protein
MTQRELVLEKVSKSPCVFIGQNHCGRWVVRDRRGLCGGLFATRTAAIRFAMFECPRTPQSVIMAPDGLELDINLDDDAAEWPMKPRMA